MPRSTKGKPWSEARRKAYEQQPRKTHCKHGHEYTPDNVYVDPRRPKSRFCRTCRKINDLRFHLASYGASPEKHQELIRKQGGLCAICEQPQKDANRPLYMDHCHATGTPRELLCIKCNMALGAVGDNPNLLLKMVAYLTKHKSEAA